MSKHKTFKYKTIMKKIFKDDSVCSWATLYESLGIYEWMESNDVKPDVRYIYMSQRLQQYISELLCDKYVSGGYSHMKDIYARQNACWEALGFAPVDAEVGDVLLVDLTQESDKKKTQDYTPYLPVFVKGY